MNFYNYLVEDIKSELIKRGLDLNNPNTPVIIDDKEEDVAYFPLYNMSGKFVGYQRYFPKSEKGTISNKIDNKLKKYYTYVTKENPEKKINQIAVYGLQSLDNRMYMFVTEGIFDINKIINLGEPGIAVLMNDPKLLKPWLKALQKKVIVIADNDQAGNKLKRIANKVYNPPKQFHDVGDMSQEEVNNFIKSIKEELKI